MANHNRDPWSLEDVRRAMGSADPKSPFDDRELEAAARLFAGSAELLQTLKGVIRILDAVLARLLHRHRLVDIAGI